MKIGTRLTLLGTIVTLTACAAVSMILYIGLSVSLYEEVDSFLEGEVQEFLAILREEDDGPLDEIERDIRRELGSRVLNDLTFRLLDSDGHLVLASHDDPSLPTTWDLKQTHSQVRKSWFETVRSDDGLHETRACSIRVTLTGRGTFIVQATYSLRGVNDALARFRNLGLIVLAAAAVGSVICGFVLARKSLRPIHAMTDVARRIGANDLSQRISRTGDDDELDQLASVLNDMLQRLESQLLQIRQFTADAAHELRTPLAALRGNAEVALGENATPESRRLALEESIDEYDRLSRLTDDLLLLARADAGHALGRIEPVALHEAIEDVVELFGAVADERGIEIRHEEECVAVIKGDRERIRQVLCNILDNALKFTPESGLIELILESGADTATITITDTGVGIDGDSLPHLFDRFYRVDEARSRGTGGSGLGLPICRTIVESYGGTIAITSRVGSGTSVLMSFPIA